MQECQERTVAGDELKCVLDALPGLVWTALPNGHVDFLSQRWGEYTGLSLEEACGWKWQAAVHPEDLSGLLEQWRSILTSNESGEMEARLLQRGAVECLFKPFSETALLEALNAALRVG